MFTVDIKHVSEALAMYGSDLGEGAASARMVFGAGMIAIAGEESCLKIFRPVESDGTEAELAVTAIKVKQTIASVKKGVLKVLSSGDGSASIVVDGIAVPAFKCGAMIPQFDAGAKKCSFTIAGKELKSALETVAYAVAKCDQRSVLEALLVDYADGVVNLVGCDGHRIAIKALSVAASGDACQCLVERSVLGTMLKTLRSGSAVSVTAGSHAILIEGDGFSFSSKAPDLTYPNWRAVLAEVERSVTVKKRDLIDAIDRVRIVSRSDNRVGIWVNPEGVSAYSVIRDMCEARETIPVHAISEGFATEFNVNAGYFLQAVEAAPGDLVEIRTKQPEKDRAYLGAISVFGCDQEEGERHDLMSMS